MTNKKAPYKEWQVLEITWLVNENMDREEELDRMELTGIIKDEKAAVTAYEKEVAKAHKEKLRSINDNEIWIELHEFNYEWDDGMNDYCCEEECLLYEVFPKE